ncbi:hypothetical protein AADZ84_14530 [Colwelliaceae bacterium MEBiC 14330]
MLKGSGTAILLSVLLHLLLLAVLIFSNINTPKEFNPVKPKIKAIKSFLYTKRHNKIVKQLPSINESQHKAKVMPTAIKTLPASIQKNTKPVKKTPKIVEQPVTKALNLSTQSKAIKQRQPTVKNSFSSFDGLSRLRANIEKQQREQAFNELTQKRSINIMDAAPLPVPQTIVPLTHEQKYQKNTSTSHVGSITKNDNGTCTIYREQILGSPVEATTSSFACGESKFDKNFKAHMQKVAAKLAIKK